MTADVSQNLEPEVIKLMQ